MDDDVGGRSYPPRIYSVHRKQDVHDFLIGAIGRSGGQVLYASPSNRAPVYFGVQLRSGERLGLLVYPFRMTQEQTRNRPADEVRGQLRLGGEASWAGDHPVAFDVAGVDITLMLGIYVEGQVLVGLQPTLFDPMPMGISFYAKTAQIAAAQDAGWTVWEHETKPGRSRGQPRGGGLETMIAFAPDRLLDYALFERQATSLGLDQPLRFSAAQTAAARRPSEDGGGQSLHLLEREFDLSSREIIEIIAGRTQLQVAVRGGVAEHHLERILTADPQVADVKRLDASGQHDFDVTLVDGREVRVECKNASPHRYASGAFKVEVQKTRASKNDPASRYYRADQFDIIAACLYSPTGEWTFRFQATSRLARHATYNDRLTPMQAVTDQWPGRVDAAADLMEGVADAPDSSTGASLPAD